MAFVVRTAARVRHLSIDFAQLTPSSWRRLDRVLLACKRIHSLEIHNWPAFGALPSFQGGDSDSDSAPSAQSSASCEAPNTHTLALHSHLRSVKLVGCTVGSGLLAAAPHLLPHARLVELQHVQESKATMGMHRRSGDEPSGVLRLLRYAERLETLTLRACMPVCPASSQHPLLASLLLLCKGHSALLKVTVEQMYFTSHLRAAQTPAAEEEQVTLPLQQLCLSMLPLSREDLACAVAACPKLQALRLEKCRFPQLASQAQASVGGHESLLALLRDTCPALHDLSMNWCSGTTSRDLLVSAGTASPVTALQPTQRDVLQKLALSGFSSLDTAAIHSLVRVFPQLVTLDLSYAKGVQAAHVLLCLRGFKQLQALDLSHTALQPHEVHILRSRLLGDLAAQGTVEDAGTSSHELLSTAPHVFVLV